MLHICKTREDMQLSCVAPSREDANLKFVALLAQADLIGELEGAGGAPDSDGCGPAFKVLRQLAQRLLTDAAERHNRCYGMSLPRCAAQHVCCRGNLRSSEIDAHCRVLSPVSMSNMDDQWCQAFCAQIVHRLASAVLRSDFKLALQPERFSH